MKGKSTFLTQHALTVGFELAIVPPDAGIFDFDIQRRTLADRGSVLEVLGFGNRAKEESRHTNRIRAYWLPWRSRHTVDVDLGADANYFFTSELNGCQFRVAPTGPHGLRAIHVAGDSQNAATAEGSTWRNAEAMGRSGTVPEYGRSRALSSSHAFGAPGPPARNTVGYGGFEWTNVFGFRHAPIFGPARWEFWYQSVERIAGTPTAAPIYRPHVARLL
jgi:hypothetical protein